MIRSVLSGLSRLIAAILILPIRGYRRWISPYTPASCRFSPTCSAYAEEALREVVRLEPGHARALQKLAELALGRGETAAARVHLQALVERAPESAEARWARQQLGRR